MTALQSLVTVLAQAQPATTADAGSVGLTHYLVVSAIVFSLGIMIIITRRNAIALLMGLELLLNSAALNFVAFGKFMTPGKVDGQIVALFLIVIAAAEASLALALTLNIFNRLNTIDVDEARSLKG
jgi:NADH-quinone oxidoreductase subunit K